jgi:hypothetical protein
LSQRRNVFWKGNPSTLAQTGDQKKRIQLTGRSEPNWQRVHGETYNMGVRNTRLIRDMGMMLCPSVLIGGSLETANFLSSWDKYFAFVISGISGK